MENFRSNDTRTGWSAEMQDALLDTPPVVCQSACCISALIVLHTTSIMPHASQRQYILLSKAAHTIALVAFKISFLPTAFNYCKPVGEHPTFEIYLLSTLQTIIFQYFNQMSSNYWGGFIFPDITALQLSARLEAPSESLRSHLLAPLTEVLV